MFLPSFQNNILLLGFISSFPACFSLIWIIITYLHIITTHGTLLMCTRVYTECLSWLPDADKTLRKGNLVRKERICWPAAARHPRKDLKRTPRGGCLLTGSMPWSAAFLTSPGSHARMAPPTVGRALLYQLSSRKCLTDKPDQGNSSTETFSSQAGWHHTDKTQLWHWWLYFK